MTRLAATEVGAAERRGVNPPIPEGGIGSSRVIPGAG